MRELWLHKQLYVTVAVLLKFLAIQALKASMVECVAAAFLLQVSVCCALRLPATSMQCGAPHVSGCIHPETSTLVVLRTNSDLNQIWSAFPSFYNCTSGGQSSDHVSFNLCMSVSSLGMNFGTCLTKRPMFTVCSAHASCRCSAPMRLSVHPRLVSFICRTSSSIC